MKKGNSIYQFLQRCLENLKKEDVYAELKVASADQLMYVKEDLILPHHSTFFEFIVTKARGTTIYVMLATLTIYFSYNRHYSVKG